MEQRTPEWHNFRKTRLTASRLGDVLADEKTRRYQDYLQDRIDMLNGAPHFQDDKPWFEHGKAWEPEARGRYEWDKGVDVEVPGAIVHPEYDFISCSPDGVIPDAIGMIEIKSHKSYKQFAAAEKKFPTQHKPQVQGSLWIIDCAWCDFISFFKNGETTLIHVRRIEPDVEYFKRLEKACLEFWDKVKKG